MPEATLQPAFMGEWTYNSANVPPPANAQLRLNTSSQANATAIYVSNISFNGIDARDWLMDMSVGSVIRLEEKGVPTRFHTFTISSAPIQQSGYVELKVTWLSGGQNLTTSVMVSVVSSMVRVTGTAATASTSNVVVSFPVRVPVTGPALVSASGTVKVDVSETVYATAGGMTAETGNVEVEAQTLLSGMAYPSNGPNGFTPGMTLRQWYVGQAIMGFLASGSPIGNLIGKGAVYCFQVADSMIEFERREAEGYRPPLVGGTPAPIPPPTPLKVV